jgi:hypothetical protein
MSQSSGYLNKPFTIWIIANVLGFSALGIALLVIPSLMMVSGLLGSTLVISIPISVAQWIALRRIFPVLKLWILSMPVGLLLAILILREIPDGFWPDDESLATLTISYLVIGLIIALPQWLLLRRQFSYSSIWLLGSSLGVAVGVGIVIATDLINQSTILSYVIAALAYAISTGLTLSWLIAKRDQSQSNLVSAT